jgi:phage terminase Nu1 subunit (DNA packaging protein)
MTVKKANKEKHPRPETEQGVLKGWAAIADFLKMPPATAQRWAKAGMPIKREGRFTTADPAELREWLGREAKMPAPAHIATNTADLSSGLQESIAAAKKEKRLHGKEKGKTQG